MPFLFFIFALFPVFNAPNPCAQQPTEIERAREQAEKERVRKIYVELTKKNPVINVVNPAEGDRVFNEDNSYTSPNIGGRLIITMPKNWWLIGLANTVINGEYYLVAQVQRLNDKKILRIILPMVLTISFVGDNTNRVWEERIDIAKYIDVGIKKYEEEELREEIKLAEYQEKAKLKNEKDSKEKEKDMIRKKIFDLQRQIFPKWVFDTIKERNKNCYTTLSIKDNEGITWEIWYCKDDTIAVPAYQSKSFTFERKPSIIKMKAETTDKKELLKEIENVKEASKQKILR